jgi:hypothetical protein
MTKKVLLRCNVSNESIFIENDSTSISQFVNWIIEYNHYVQRYLENEIDTFVFDNANHLVACKKKAIKMNLLPIATIKVVS